MKCHLFSFPFISFPFLRSVIPACPIMALTATAVPRVRDDIIKTLSMRAPHVAQSSYDRTNLEIKVCVKKGGREEEVTKMAKEIRKFFTLLFCVFLFLEMHSRYQDNSIPSLSSHRPPTHLTATVRYVSTRAGTQPIDSSTIVYCATTREVDSISESLSGLLRAQGRKVVKYHGSMGPVARKESHVAFLTGQAPVIVYVLFIYFSCFLFYKKLRSKQRRRHVVLACSFQRFC